MSLTQSQWFTEMYENGTAFSVRYSRKLFDRTSEFQRIEIFDTDVMGRVLILNGCFMVTEKDSFIYHEMLTHPGMSVLSNPKKVLVIGGGDGGVVTELVKYPGLESVTLCEIDPLVVDTCREYFPEISAGLSDPRVQIVCRDGAAYVSEFDGEFDLVLVDSTDPVGPGVALFQISFYEAIKKGLKDGGAAVFQTESPLFMQKVFAHSVADLREVFGAGSATPYLATIPSYPGGLWSFTFCSQSVDPVKTRTGALDPSLLEKLDYYSPQVHPAAFALPRFVQKLLA
ncbi:MAG TPA: polyamine aminopropyltransferase [Desulfomonilaceae bacterium]|nr:polyamine aminopropyltransferase [Desulfomonilaceae bacterium]